MEGVCVKIQVYGTLLTQVLAQSGQWMKMVNVSYVVIDTSSGTKWSVDEDGKRKLCDNAPSTPKHKFWPKVVSG